MAGALDGLQVLDLTQYVAGPYCTKLLALYGATVVKVERPRRGDPMRYVGPFVGDVPGPDRSLAFLDLNVNKLGITLDLATETGRQICLDLVRRSDVVVESFRPGTLDRFGLGYTELKRVRPGIVLTSISNFGQTGPYRDLPASEIVLYAMGHEMYGTGQPDAEPLSMAPRLNLYFAGLTAAVGTMGAVLGQDLQGHGEWVDVSIMETFLSSIDRRADSLVAYAYCGEKMVRSATVDGGGTPPAYNRCRDGYIHVNIATAAAWQAAARAIDEPWAFDERFTIPIEDPAIWCEFESHWLTWCLAHAKDEIVARFQRVGLPCAPVNSIADLLADPHLQARGFWQTLHHPVAGTAQYAGLPFVMHGTPGRLTRPAPMLGADNAAIYGKLGLTAADLARLASLGVI